MRTKRILHLPIICIILSACNCIEKDVKEVIDIVEPEKKKNFVAFIEHYSKDIKKKKVAKFIIANLLNKYSIIGEDYMEYQEYIDSIDRNWKTINSIKNHSYNLKKKHSNIKKNTTIILDIDKFELDSFVQQTNLAFQIWEESPWNIKYSRDIFEEYIVPHRIANEPLEYNWRKNAYMQYKDLLKECQDSSILATCSHIYQQINYQTNNLFWGEPLQSFSNNNHFKRGTCSDKAVYTAMIMRALAIPTAVEFIPSWGDNNNGHTFNSLIFPDGTCKGYNNKNDFADGLNLPGKVTKIYRKTFKTQRNSPIYKYKDIEYIPETFINHDIRDVTQYYDIPLTNVTLTPQLDVPKSHFVYLSVFAPNGWRPVAWAEFKNGKADFKHIGVGYSPNVHPIIKGENYGKGCLYLSVSYEDEKVKYMNYPFILNEKESIRYLIPDTMKTETVTLYRKYPRKKRIIDFAKKLKGGYFELSNTSDFSQSNIVYYVDSIPKSYIQTIPLPKKKYRYIRFYKRNGGLSLSELGCLDTNLQRVHGKIIADPVLMEDIELNNISDENLLSYFDIGNLKNIWVGLDFGSPKNISALFFCPRTDDNDISPGDKYELFYWNKKWISLGKKIANSNSLTYEKVPRNSLLWLQNQTKGKEERPFTYDNEKQIWW